MKTYAVYHGMDGEQQASLGNLIVDDDNKVAEFDGIAKEMLDDALRDNWTFTDTVERFNGHVFVPQDGDDPDTITKELNRPT